MLWTKRSKRSLIGRYPNMSFHNSFTEIQMEHLNTPQKYFEQSMEDFFQPLLATPLPDDRMYSRGHMWIRNESTTTATIGIDHVGAYFLRPVVSVVLPQTPSRVELQFAVCMARSSGRNNCAPISRLWNLYRVQCRTPGSPVSPARRSVHIRLGSSHCRNRTTRN